MNINKLLRELSFYLWKNDFLNLNSQIIILKNQIKNLKEKNKIDKFENYYNNKYLKVSQKYSGRFIPNFGSYSVDVRDFFINPLSDELQNIVGPWKNLNDDQKAIKCQEYVFKNIKYVTDKKDFGLNEYWEYPQETLFTKKGDCDDGAILIANLMLASGIPYWKIRINTGNVYSPQGKYLGGHCWTSYFYEAGKKWVGMDWCFYPSLIKLSERPDYKDEVIYGNGQVWFSFNQKFAFKKV